MKGMTTLERVGLRSSCAVVPTMPTPLYRHIGFYLNNKLFACLGRSMHYWGKGVTFHIPLCSLLTLH